MDFLQAYRRTDDPFYFDPRGERVALYRNGNGNGRENSSLDDGQTPSAIRFFMHIDRALKFKHSGIHSASTIALDALLVAQFPHRGFPNGEQASTVSHRCPLR